jgi:DNA-binding NarL/FixJ family response regulator
MRILLVDDDRLLLASIARILRVERPQWELATAQDGAEALRILRTDPVDLLVTDLHMPGVDGMALLAAVREDAVLRNLPLIFITAETDRITMRKGMASGADDFLTKPFSGDELVMAIEGRLRRLERGGDPSQAARNLQNQLQALLTERELDILTHIGRGEVTKDIAGALALSPMTVSVHRANIMRKLDLHNAAALAALASRAQLF